MKDLFYCMVDRPAVRFDGERMRDAHYTNKPRREHRTLQKAHEEAQRLARKTNMRVLVLQVVETVTIGPAQATNAVDTNVQRQES